MTVGEALDALISDIKASIDRLDAYIKDKLTPPIEPGAPDTGTPAPEAPVTTPGAEDAPQEAPVDTPTTGRTEAPTGGAAQPVEDEPVAAEETAPEAIPAEVTTPEDPPAGS